MKYYKVIISGALFAKIFKNGVQTEFNERITVKNGIPQGGSLIAVQLADGVAGNLEVLFVTDEPGEIPEAVNIWHFAEQVTPEITTEYLGRGLLTAESNTR